MRLLDLLKVVVDVAVMGWTWQVKGLLALAHREVLTAARAPRRMLLARDWPILSLHRASQLVVAWAWPVSLFREKMRLHA